MYATVTTRFETLVVERAGSVVFITLDRPDARNAMNTRMIEEIRDFFLSIRDDRSIRCAVLQGAGGMFCAGADIKEMRNPANQTQEAQLYYSAILDDMLLAVQTAPQVTIAAVEGAAMGGGFGLMCVTDITIADETARMALPEVRLGIAPAVISPYVVERIGLTRTRQLALTGRVIHSAAAFDMGLVQDIAPTGRLDEIVDDYVKDVLQGAPNALATTKELLVKVAKADNLDETREYRLRLLGQLRSSDEGREGMAAFAEKRKPNWVPEDEHITV